MVYDIKNYVKLLCIRIDHFESHIVDEQNTTDSKEIEEFIKRYQNRQGLKILMIQMNNMEIVTFDEIIFYWILEQVLLLSFIYKIFFVHK